MSIAELKKTADQLNARERRWLKCYLAAAERSATPEWRERMAAKRRSAGQGGGVAAARYARTVRANG